jgi:DeoR family transcriptional regulator of aga operon
MSRGPRRQALLELFVKHRRVEVEAAATAPDVSAATIRRDVDQPAERQIRNGRSCSAGRNGGA